MVARLFFIWLSLIYCRCDWSFCSGPGCYAEIAQRPSMSVLSNTFATDSRQFFLELNDLTVRNLVMWNANGTLTACLCHTRFLFWICGILPSSAGSNSPGIQQSGFWCRNCVCAHCFFLPLDPNWKRTWRQCSKEVSELISLRRFIYFISPVCYFCVFFCLIPWSNHWRSSQRHLHLLTQCLFDFGNNAHQFAVNPSSLRRLGCAHGQKSWRYRKSKYRGEMFACVADSCSAKLLAGKAVYVSGRETEMDLTAVSSVIDMVPMAHLHRLVEGVGRVRAWHAAAVHHHARCHVCAECLGLKCSMLQLW